MGEKKTPKKSEDLDEHGSSNGKTPMWHIHTLARYHKITPEYKLVKEETKKKTKRFVMSLTLKQEVYNGHGNTKKQAKQNAAKKAMKETSLSKPPVPKKPSVNPDALTATVKLNGWAMARRKTVTYEVCEKQVGGGEPLSYHTGQPQQFVTMPTYYTPTMDGCYEVYPVSPVFAEDCPTFPNYSQFPNPYYNPIKRPSFFRVCVQVDEEKFYGEGPTQQAARHDAAQHALDKLPLEPESTEKEEKPKSVKKKAKKTQEAKTSVCFLNEEALARNMSVVVSKVSEKGLAHLKYYTVEITVGHYKNKTLDKKRISFKAEASGTTKKAAKQAAACLILKEMKEELPPRKQPEPKVETGPLKGHSPPLSTLHPVSRLMQICQAQKIKAPTYKLVEDSSGEDKFTMKCILKDNEVTATGVSKKEAKKAASEAMLTLLGKQRNLLDLIPNKDSVPQKSILKIKELSSDVSKHLQVKFLDDVITS